MARKDLLKNVTNLTGDRPKTSGRSDYAMRGASKTMKESIDSLAENSRRLLEGENHRRDRPGPDRRLFRQ